MNKIIEYINDLDKKNFIMLIVSIFILIFLIIYYLNDYFMAKENVIINKRRELIIKISKIKRETNQIKKLKQKNQLLNTKLFNLQKDLKYVLSEIDSSKILIVNDKKFLNILHKLIKLGSNINASFEINESKSLEKYKLYITGKTKTLKFFDLTSLLKAIQSPKAVVSINKFSALKNKDDINYEINVSIWSFR